MLKCNETEQITKLQAWIVSSVAATLDQKQEDVEHLRWLDSAKRTPFFLFIWQNYFV